MKELMGAELGPDKGGDETQGQKKENEAQPKLGGPGFRTEKFC
jgi:hypothetical protein